MRNFLCMALIAGILGATSLAADRKVDILPQERWSNVYGGKEVVLHFAVSTPELFKGTVGWSLSSAGRTLVRNERAVTVEPGREETVEARFDVPKVKEGVVMQGVLTVSLYAQGSQKAAAVVEKDIWMFPEDAFAGQKERLKELDINLFDPEKKTAAVFVKAGIPYREVNSVDAVAGITNGMLIVGENISLKDYRGLGEVMMKIAEAGVPVLCLAPGGGELAMPSADSNLPKPAGMKFRRNEMIRSLDKRLDADGWAPDGKVVTGGILLRGERGLVMGEVARDGKGWPWVEMEFEGKAGGAGRKGSSRLVICGFGIIEKWDAGPTPQFLMAKLLEYVRIK